MTKFSHEHDQNKITSGRRFSPAAGPPILTWDAPLGCWVARREAIRAAKPVFGARFCSVEAYRSRWRYVEKVRDLYPLNLSHYLQSRITWETRAAGSFPGRRIFR